MSIGPRLSSKTPCWDGKKRYQVKQLFNKFQRTYKGVVPTGRWADHFSIISRPIRHAILPKYLQLHFARTLYYQRHRLISLTTLDAGDIGRRLAENAHYAPTRFQEFLQQEELTGRIVLALLEGKRSKAANRFTRRPLSALLKIWRGLVMRASGSTKRGDTSRIDSLESQLGCRALG